MDIKKANLGQLLYIARYTELRNNALLELDRRLYGEFSKNVDYAR